MKYQLPNQDFFINNRQKFVESMAECEGKRSAIFFNSPVVLRNGDVPYKYRPDSDFFYLTGIQFPHSALLLFPDGEKAKEVLFIHRQDPKRIEWEGKEIDQDEATEISGIETVQFIDNFTSAIARYAYGSDMMYINHRFHGLDKPLDAELMVINQIRERFPHISFEKAGPLMAKLRLIKSPEEIKLLRKAIEITHESLQAAIRESRAGMFEYQFQALLEYYYKYHGSDYPAYGTIVGSGKNATILHYEKNADPIQENDLVLVDSGAEYGYYAADITRTFPISGKFTSRQKEVYEAVLDVQKQILAAIKPGVQYKEIYELNQKLCAQAAQKLGLEPEEEKETKKPTQANNEQDEELKEAQRYRKYWKHGVGHSLGLDVHDINLKPLEWELSVGNVLTIEPGLYLEDEGIGVRIEDDVLITKDGIENLSVMIPKEINELENLKK